MTEFNLFHFSQEKPHLFQFVPNERQVKSCQFDMHFFVPVIAVFLTEIISDSQVKAANKLLKSMPPNGKKQKVDGVPVFGAQNLDIAVATADGIKW